MSDNVKDTPVQEAPVVEEEAVMQEETPKQDEKKGFLKKAQGHILQKGEDGARGHGVESPFHALDRRVKRL